MEGVRKMSIELAACPAYILAGLAGLYYGAELLVKGGAALARRAGVSPLVIGLTLVAFATSAPETVVSVGAAIDGNADIAIGNIVGSNICNIALILGLCGCIAPMTVKRQLVRFDAPVMVAATLLFMAFYRSAHGLSRLQGALLLAGLVVYTVWNIRASRRECAGEPPDGAAPPPPLGRALAFTALGLLGLIAGAKLFLAGTIWAAGKLGIPDAVIGLTVVAVGTSLPELATSVVAALKRENDIAIGNILGSNIFNILGILGLAALTRPMRHASIDAVDLGMMLFLAAAMLPILRSGWKLSRREGVFLLLVYIGYTAYLTLVRG